jgi:hypothetical protein
MQQAAFLMAEMPSMRWMMVGLLLAQPELDIRATELNTVAAFSICARPAGEAGNSRW